MSDGVAFLPNTFLAAQRALGVIRDRTPRCRAAVLCQYRAVEKVEIAISSAPALIGHVGMLQAYQPADEKALNPRQVISHL
jgi:hypothetical protein